MMCLDRPTDNEPTTGTDLARGRLLSGFGLLGSVGIRAAGAALCRRFLEHIQDALLALGRRRALLSASRGSCRPEREI
jgi:hypothetical protein